MSKWHACCSQVCYWLANSSHVFLCSPMAHWLSLIWHLPLSDPKKVNPNSPAGFLSLVPTVGSSSGSPASSADSPVCSPLQACFQRSVSRSNDIKITNKIKGTNKTKTRIGVFFVSAHRRCLAHSAWLRSSCQLFPKLQRDLADYLPTSTNNSVHTFAMNVWRQSGTRPDCWDPKGGATSLSRGSRLLPGRTRLWSDLNVFNLQDRSPSCCIEWNSATSGYNCQTKTYIYLYILIYIYI